MAIRINARGYSLKVHRSGANTFANNIGRRPLKAAHWRIFRKGVTQFTIVIL